MNFYLPQEQPTSSYSRLDSGDYELVVRQQPREALITQQGKEKNRKPIDPPPIVQIRVPETRDPIRQFLQSPYLFMICHLEPGEPAISAQEAREALTGSISSSLHRLKDVDNEDGGFFVFGDISVKTPGTHRLRFTLMELQKDEGRVVSLRSTLSEPFNVVPQKHWRGLEESTHLSRAFSDQGVRLRLRKENRTMSQKRNFQSFQDPATGGSSSVTDQPASSVYGESPVTSQYGFGEGLPKRQRSDDYSQHSVYSSGERAIPGYAPRDFASSVPGAAGYSAQRGAPRQSPQTAFGFQQPTASSSLPSYYGHSHGQSSSSIRGVETGARQAQATTPGSSFGFQTGGISNDPSEYFSATRRSTDTYSSMQHTPVIGSTPSDVFQSAGQSMYASQKGAPTGSGATSMYQQSSMPSPLGAATGGSSTGVHTPVSVRGAALNPSAQSFSFGQQLHSQHLPSQPLSSQGYGNLPDPQTYSFDQQAAQYAQQQQQQQQVFQQSSPTTMQHLTQPLSAPHQQQRPPDTGDPYGQNWPSHYAP